MDRRVEDQQNDREDGCSVEALTGKQRLNAEAPEFVPRGRPRPLPQVAIPIPMPLPIPFPIRAPAYYAYYRQHHDATSGGGYGSNGIAFYDAYAGVGSPVGNHTVDARNDVGSNSSSTSKQGSTSDASQKILNQVEFYFSDINLATTDQLFKHMSKDPEGYVPLHVVASFKKIKTGITGSMDLANILRNSKKLLVSEDGKKVKRQDPLTESDMEELQSRIIIAENLPDDHSHQNLMKIFSSIGSVKSIRTCPPQITSSGASSTLKTGKGDANAMHYSGKFHAFVEYESAELAEKAAVELTDEGDWRNGLKARLLPKNVAKHTHGRVRNFGHEGHATSRKDETTSGEIQQLKENCSKDSFAERFNQFNENQTENSTTNNTRGKERRHNTGNNNNNNKGKGSKGKGHGRVRNNQSSESNSVLGSSPSEDSEKTAPNKAAHVPRMPDGTKGFSMGRGKSLSVKAT